jgi:hypothetical protein
MCIFVMPRSYYPTAESVTLMPLKLGLLGNPLTLVETGFGELLYLVNTTHLRHDKVEEKLTNFSLPYKRPHQAPPTHPT